VDLTQRLHRMARDGGAVASGVCTAEPFADVAASLRQRVRDGMNARLRFTFADPERATSVRLTHPWARFLFVAGWSYLPAAGSPGPAAPGTVRVARFAGEDHYQGLRRILAGIAVELETRGFRSGVLCDDNGLVDRAAAVRAGLGWWGKNTMVLAPGVGPWMLLGTVATDAPLLAAGSLDTDRPMVRDCGSCDACLPACPTGALVSPGVLDARRCLSAVLQSPGVIPRELRPAVGDRLYGCDDCLDACPPGRRRMEAATAPAGRHLATAVLAASDAELIDRFGHFYLPKRRPTILRRNALVVLGNQQVGAAAVLEHLRHPDWLLRAHAAWAAGRIGGRAVVKALAGAAADEQHPIVIEEIDAARHLPLPADGARLPWPARR
jgi:epoxyqueuosine reductase